jgi:hypothetical protein
MVQVAALVKRTDDPRNLGNEKTVVCSLYGHFQMGGAENRLLLHKNYAYRSLRYVRQW